MEIDLVIPFHSKDANTLEPCLCSCLKHIQGIKRVFIIGKNPPKVNVLRDKLGTQNVFFIKEDELFSSPINMHYVYNRLRKRNFHIAWRAGWLFQQFIKLGAANAIVDITPQYLVVDSDVVFLKKIRLSENDKYFFTKEPFTYPENHPYYKTYESLLRTSPKRNQFTFIANYMLFDCSIVSEMLSIFEANWSRPWQDAIIDAIDSTQLSAFSEYETYGIYTQTNHSEKMLLRELRCIQNFKTIPENFEQFSNEADLITLHEYKRSKGSFIYKAKMFLRYWGILRS